MSNSVSHDAWWGQCAGFHDFRTALADAIGVNLDAMEGYGGSTVWKTVKDPLRVLLEHEDNRGTISPKKAAKLAARLRELLPKLDGLTKRRALRFAKGCEAAVKANEPLLFQ